MPAANQPALFIERRGANLMIRLRGSRDTQEYTMFSAIPSLPGNTVVLISIDALTRGDISQAVNQAAHQALAALPGPPPPGHRLWLALSGLGQPDTRVRSWPQQLAEELGVEVLAPQGPLSLVPGGLLFVGGVAGSNSWRSFRRGDTSRPWGARYPQPDWEAQLPPGPVTSAHKLTVEPIPAGLLVRTEGAPPTPPADRAYAVAVHPGRPRLVLGRPGEPARTPAQIAALISIFPPTLSATLELVPHTPEVAAAAWFTELARCLGREVRAASGLPLYGHDGRVHVIAHDIDGGQLFRHPAASLRYTPNGTVRVLECRPPPAGWISTNSTVHRLPGAVGLAPHDPVAEVVPAGFALVPAAVAGSPHSAAARPAESHRLTITIGLPGAPLPDWAPGTLRRLVAGINPDARAHLRILVLAEPTDAQKKSLMDPTYALEFASARQEDVPRAPRPVPVSIPSATHPIPPARHRSTGIEQIEFQRLAGELFTSALTVVDAALTASAHLRVTIGSKADLVAVHLYLRSGEFGALAVNSVLRAGARGPIAPAYLACLTSGLRRLPAHRGVVFRHIRVPVLGGVGERYSEGDVISEPGFLSATAAEDLAVPTGSVDLLIWSRSGRRTEELGAGGLPQEIVFAARTRLKVLAVVRDGGPPAVLLRELHPDETPASWSSDSTDIAVLSKLLRALRRRQAASLRVLEDRDQIGRLAPPLGPATT
jgi:hypothetical protein